MNTATAEKTNENSNHYAILAEKLNLWYGSFQALYDIDLKILAMQTSARTLWRMGKYKKSIALNEDIIQLRFDYGFEYELAFNFNNIAIV